MSEKKMNAFLIQMHTDMISKQAKYIYIFILGNVFNNKRKDLSHAKSDCISEREDRQKHWSECCTHMIVELQRW